MRNRNGISGIKSKSLLRRMLPCLLFLALPATGVLGNDRTNDQPAPAVIVHMTAANKFAPEKVTIKAGESVRWVNDADGPSHTVTTDQSAAQDEDDVEIPAGAKPFSSGVIGPGRFFQQTFERPGTYRYTCVPHEYSRMFGEVVVTQ